MKRILTFLLMIYSVAACLTARGHGGYIPVSGGARLYYEERGHGEPLILLHGHSLDTRMWDGQFRVLARHYRVVRFDFRGYGRSSAQTETFPFTHLDDLLTLMDSLHIERAHIVGLSMGAFIAGDMLGVAPERMLSCVLASGGPKKQPGPSEPMDSAEWARRDTEIAALKEKGVETMKAEWLEALISSGGSNREAMRRPLRRMIRDWSAWQPLHHEVRLIYGNDAVRLIRERHPAVPTLVLEGGAPANRHSGRSWLSDVMPRVTVRVLPDCGHMMNMEQPTAFNAAVLDFLSSDSVAAYSLAAVMTAWGAEVPQAGPQYMPAVMEPVTAPFDVSGIHLPEFAARTVTVKMAAKGLSTRAIQTAIDRMSRRGGGTVVIPDGEWTSGRIILRSGVRLHLSDGAVLTFSGEAADYLPVVPSRNEGVEVMSAGAMIYADSAENIAVTGRGRLVGPSMDCGMWRMNVATHAAEGRLEYDTRPPAERICDGQDGRPFLLPMFIAPIRCRNVLIEGITLERSLYWNIVPQYCDNVIIRGVTVSSAGHGRTDGIDIESTSNALIEYCSLDCGDDCYTIKSGRGEDGVRVGIPSRNVVIRHSIALRGGGGLVIGTETAGSMWNIYMHDCLFDGTDQALRFKTRRPRGGGAHDVWVERVTARNIRRNAFTVDMLGSAKWVGELADRFPAREVNRLTPEFKNIHVSDFTVDSCARFIDVKALPERPLTNVLIERADVRCGDFLRLQDAEGFVLHDVTVRTPAPTASLDGCRSVMLLDVDFVGRQLTTHTRDTTNLFPSPTLTKSRR